MNFLRSKRAARASSEPWLHNNRNAQRRRRRKGQPRVQTVYLPWSYHAAHSPTTTTITTITTTTTTRRPRMCNTRVLVGCTASGPSTTRTQGPAAGPHPDAGGEQHPRWSPAAEETAVGATGRWQQQEHRARRLVLTATGALPPDEQPWPPPAALRAAASPARGAAWSKGGLRVVCKQQQHQHHQHQHWHLHLHLHLHLQRPRNAALLASQQKEESMRWLAHSIAPTPSPDQQKSHGRRMRTYPCTPTATDCRSMQRSDAGLGPRHTWRQPTRTTTTKRGHGLNVTGHQGSNAATRRLRAKLAALACLPGTLQGSNQSNVILFFPEKKRTPGRWERRH